jgi:hypothetical protein
MFWHRRVLRSGKRQQVFLRFPERLVRDYYTIDMLCGARSKGSYIIPNIYSGEY